MHKRFEYGSATALLASPDSHVYILSNVYSRERGKGHATALMQEIVDYVDDQKGSIFLTVQRFGNPRDGLNNHELIRFYSKFGFVRDERTRNPIRMIRYFKEA